jgi:biotin carboxyl carrier protein
MTRRRWFVSRDERTATVDVERVTPERFRVRLDGSEGEFEVTLLGRAGATAVTADGRVFTFFPTQGGLVAHPSRERLEVTARPRRAAAGASGHGAGESMVRAPMPGRVLKLLVGEGDAVSAGAPLVVVEAMKMENELLAARAGIVKRIRVQVGDTVERDSALLELE